MKNAIAASLALVSSTGFLFLQAGAANAVVLNPGSTLNFQTFTSAGPLNVVNSNSNLFGVGSATDSFVPYITGGTEIYPFKDIADLNSLAPDTLILDAPDFQFYFTSIIPSTAPGIVDTVPTSFTGAYALGIVNGYFQTDDGIYPAQGFFTGSSIGGFSQFGGTLTVGAVPEPFTILGAATAAAFGAAYKRKLANKK